MRSDKKRNIKAYSNQLPALWAGFLEPIKQRGHLIGVLAYCMLCVIPFLTYLRPLYICEYILRIKKSDL